MGKDIDTASIMAGYHAVIVQLHQQAGKSSKDIHVFLSVRRLLWVSLDT